MTAEWKLTSNSRPPSNTWILVFDAETEEICMGRITVSGKWRIVRKEKSKPQITSWCGFPLLSDSQIKNYDTSSEFWIATSSPSSWPPIPEDIIVDGYNRKSKRRCGPRIGYSDIDGIYIWDTRNAESFEITHWAFLPKPGNVLESSKYNYRRVKTSTRNRKSQYPDLSKSERIDCLTARVFLGKLLSRPPDDLYIDPLIRCIKHGIVEMHAKNMSLILIKPTCVDETEAVFSKFSKITIIRLLENKKPFQGWLENMLENG